jgi:hypothetical protein
VEEVVAMSAEDFRDDPDAGVEPLDAENEQAGVEPLDVEDEEAGIEPLNPEQDENAELEGEWEDEEAHGGGGA